MNYLREVSDNMTMEPKVRKGFGLVHGSVRSLLRTEGAVVVLVAAILYQATGASWMWFALLFLSPDLSFAGYLGGPRLGAVLYNLFHSYIVPLILFGVSARYSSLKALALIWIAHIGFDRSVGYGLKYASAFGDTHLGKMGR